MVRIKRNYRKHGPKTLKGHPRQKGKKRDITKKCLTNRKGELKKWLIAANGQVYVPKRPKGFNKDGTPRRVSAAQRANRAAFGAASTAGLLRKGSGVSKRWGDMPGLEAVGTSFLPNKRSELDMLFDPPPPYQPTSTGRMNKKVSVPLLGGVNNINRTLKAGQSNATSKKNAIKQYNAAQARLAKAGF